MKVTSVLRVLCVAAGAALLGGCGTTGAGPSAGGVGALSGPARFVPGARSWMTNVPTGTLLLYATDDSFGTVDVYGFPVGKLVGQASGFSGPAGLCSDKNGNVYVADSTTGIASEIAAGTTNVVKTWQVGGDLYGCSVSATGDLAFTDFSRYRGSSGPGGVTVFRNGSSNGIRHPGPAYDSGAGYDSQGNLWVQCDHASPCANPAIYELPNGGSTWKRATLRGARVGLPAAIELMGKTLGIGDQAPNGQQNFGIYSATVNGTTLRVTKTTIATSTCELGNTNVVQWANLSRNPNGLQNNTIVTAVTGPNDACTGTPIETWPFPQGGVPSSSFTPAGNSYGVTLVKV